MIKKILYYLKNPGYILLRLDNMRLITLNDKTYIKLFYKERTGKKLNLKDPKTFNEKIQWLKLYDRKDIYTTMVDKYKVKGYISDILGEEYVIPTLGIYDKFDDIDFNKLPNQFVIKCNHDSEGLVIVKDKKKFGKDKAKEKITKALKTKYYYLGREWAYKNVKPKIIVEKYMEEKGNNTIRDFKFFCFNGKPKILYVSDGSHTDHQTIAFFDMEYNQLDIKRTDYEDYDKLPNKPINFEKMKDICCTLSKDIPHVRVDLYEINGKVYFGELTLYSSDGLVPFKDEEWNEKMGDLIKIPSKE